MSNRQIGRQVPSVGRMVHFFTTAYTTLMSEQVSLVPLDATVCSVVNASDPESPCYLAGHTPFGEPLQLGLVPFSATPKAGHWSWPAFVPRVEASESHEV